MVPLPFSLLLWGSRLYNLSVFPLFESLFYLIWVLDSCFLLVSVIPCFLYIGVKTCEVISTIAEPVPWFPSGNDCHFIQFFSDVFIFQFKEPFFKLDIMSWQVHASCSHGDLMTTSLARNSGFSWLYYGLQSWYRVPGHHLHSQCLTSQILLLQLPPRGKG